MGCSLPRIRVTPPGPRSLEMARRLSRVESRNVTHLTSRFPVFWEEVRGCNVRDVDGNVYLDFTGAFGVAALGHSAPGITEAIRSQAGRMVHGMGDVHPPVGKVEFLEALSELSPWPETRVILGSSGSEAVEAALKTALLARGRPGIVAFQGAYHGLTGTALATTHRELFRGAFQSRLYPGVRFAPFPDVLRHGPGAAEESLERVEWLLREGDGGDEVGAVIVEPIQGRAGVRIPPEGFLEELARISRDAGALLVFDEIFTGLGRTGELFAGLHDGVLPDLLLLGKGLGGGLPLSACMGPSEIMNAWPPSRGEAMHTSTFLGNPLACAAGLAFLEELNDQGLLERSRRLGARFLEDLREGLGGVPGVADIRGRGLFLGVELVETVGETGPVGSAAPARDLEPLAGGAVRVAEEALRRGILVLPAGEAGHVVELSPPLTMEEEEGRWGIAQLISVIREVVTWGKPA